MARSSRKLLTVHDVAKLASVTERTVWADISAGRLASVRAGHRRLIPRSAIRKYRHTPHARKKLLTVPQVAWVLDLTERAVRNAVRFGWIPVLHVSRRRVYVDADAAFVYRVAKKTRTGFRSRSLAEYSREEFEKPLDAVLIEPGAPKSPGLSL